jgi:hypothetical protein
MAASFHGGLGPPGGGFRGGLRRGGFGGGPGAARMDSAARRILAGDRSTFPSAKQPDMNKTYAVAGDGSIDSPLPAGWLSPNSPPTKSGAQAGIRPGGEVLQGSERFHFIANFVEGDVLVPAPCGIPQPALPRDSILTLVEAISRSGGLAENAAGDRAHLALDSGRQHGSAKHRSRRPGMLDTMDFSKDQ